MNSNWIELNWLKIAWFRFDYIILNLSLLNLYLFKHNLEKQNDALIQSIWLWVKCIIFDALKNNASKLNWYQPHWVDRNKLNWKKKCYTQWNALNQFQLYLCTSGQFKLNLNSLNDFEFNQTK